MADAKRSSETVDFGRCRVCKKRLDHEEYHLGLGRCKDCARKCDEEVGFGTQYTNVEDRDEKAP